MKSFPPLVSVIIPTFNRRRYICDAVESVLNQTMQDFEVIVMDDGSTDNSGEMILQKYGDTVIYRYQRNQGRSAARNTAMQLARGRYVAFLDSDDVWKSEKLARQIPVLETSQDVGLVQTFTEVMNADGSPNQSETEKRMSLYRKAMKRGYTYVGMSQQCIMFLSTVIFRRSLLEKIGLMDTLTEGFEDWDWYLRAALVTTIATVPEPLALYRIHPDNTGTDEFTAGRILVSLKHLELLETLAPVQMQDRVKCNFYIQLAATYYQKGDLAECGKWMRRATSLYSPAILRHDNLRYLLAMCFPRWTMAARMRSSRYFRRRQA